MSGTLRRGGWIVAASIGAVEALKDQLGICRWNYALRSMQQNAKSSIQTRLIPANLSSSSSSSSSTTNGIIVREREKIGRTEKGLKKVMDLSSLGPTTVRF